MFVVARYAMAGAILCPGGLAAQVTLPSEAELRLGALEAPEEQVFGEVRDVVVTADGDFILLDFQARKLKRFDGDGQLVAQSGREGQGPGEFNWPQSLELLNPDTLLLLDSGNRRISFYDIRGGQLKLAREVTIPTIFRDLCLIHRRLFLIGAWQGYGVHEFTAEGNHVGSMAELPTVSGGDQVAITKLENLFSGSAVCHGRRQAVVILPLILGEVLVVDLESGGLNRLEIPDYRATRIAATTRGTIQFAPDPETGTAHEAVGLAVLDGASVLFQVQEKRRGEPIRAVESYVLDLASMRVHDVGVQLPAVHRITGGLFVAAGGELFPEVVVWRIRAR